MKEKKNKQNNSMFIYTALIFVVALLFIILAFFGQTNLTKLRGEINKSELQPTEAAITAVPATEEVQTPSPTPGNPDEYAIMTNTISSLKAENDELNAKINVYDELLSANGYISVGNLDKAAEIIAGIDRNALSDDQIILFDQITNTINEGKEQ